MEPPFLMFPATCNRAILRHRLLAISGIGLTVVFSVAAMVMRDRAERDARLGREAGAVAEAIRSLERSRDEMAELESKMRAAFFEQARASARQAKGEAAELQDTAFAEQREIVRLLEDSLADLDLYAAKRSNVNFDRAVRAHEAAAEKHARILVAQQKAQGVLTGVAPDHTAAAAQEAARAAQAQVGEVLRDLTAARDLARGSRLRTPDEREYEHHTYHVARAERWLAEIPAKLERLAKRDAGLAAMEQQLGHEAGAAGGLGFPDREREAAAVRAARERIAKQRQDAEKRFARAPAELSRHRPKVEEYEKRLARSTQAPTPEDRKVAEFQQEAIVRQLRAIELQLSARTALGGFPAVADLAALAREIRSCPEPPGVDSDIISLEREIRAAFRRIHAMDTAMLRRLPLTDAMNLTALAPLEVPSRSQGDIAAAISGVRAMLDEARRLLSPGAPRRRQLAEALEHAAADDPETPARDLTRLLDGGGEVPGDLLPGGPGGPPVLDAEIVSLSALSLVKREVWPPSAWMFLDRWHILGPFDNPKRRNLDAVFPPEAVVDLAAAYPGKNGVPVRWESVRSGTPNVVPPFVCYNRKRPVAGLDSNLGALHNLRYTIYYAYGEIHFERESDRWVAVGSDDHSKLWINGLPVWSSGRNPKAWKIDEGYRKVRFKAGLNRVLYRIENGDDRTEFSLLIGMEP